MTFNEARAAIAIGCKVCLPEWSYILCVYKMDTRYMEYESRDTLYAFKTTPYNYTQRNDWEIYDEHKRSSAGTEDRL